MNFILRTKVVADEEEHVDGDDFVEHKVHLEELINNYNAVLIATGTWKSRTSVCQAKT